MAIDNYEKLTAFIRSKTKFRNDSDDLIQTFISLAEEKIYSNEINQPLRIKEMDTRSTALLSTTERYLVLPARFEEQRQFRINLNIDLTGDPWFKDVRYMSPEQLCRGSNPAYPRFFTATSQIEFDTISDQAYELTMQYFARLPALTTVNDTNAILTRYPSIYINGTLSEGYDYHDEPNDSKTYNDKQMASILSANTSQKKGRYGAAPVITKEIYGP